MIQLLFPIGRSYVLYNADNDGNNGGDRGGNNDPLVAVGAKLFKHPRTLLLLCQE